MTIAFLQSETMRRKRSLHASLICFKWHQGDPKFQFVIQIYSRWSISRQTDQLSFFCIGYVTWKRNDMARHKLSSSIYSYCPTFPINQMKLPKLFYFRWKPIVLDCCLLMSAFWFISMNVESNKAILSMFCLRDIVIVSSRLRYSFSIICRLSPFIQLN